MTKPGEYWGTKITVFKGKKELGILYTKDERFARLTATVFTNTLYKVSVEPFYKKESSDNG